MKVKDIMIKDVVLIGPDDSFYDIVELFSEKKISGAPVAVGSKPVGMVSESDVMKFISKKDMISGIEHDRKEIRDNCITGIIFLLYNSGISLGAVPECIGLVWNIHYVSTPVWIIGAVIKEEWGISRSSNEFRTVFGHFNRVAAIRAEYLLKMVYGFGCNMVFAYPACAVPCIFKIPGE